MKKVVYVTGCLGFIGHHLTRILLSNGFYVIGVDKMTYASNDDFLVNLQRLGAERFKFIKSDINDLDKLYDCDYVINTAAETHVDNSIVSSEVFLKSNVNGVHHYEITETSGHQTTKIDVGTNNTIYPSADAISNYDYEQTRQDQLRQIKLLDPQYVDRFVKEFHEKIKETVI